MPNWMRCRAIHELFGFERNRKALHGVSDASSMSLFQASSRQRALVAVEWRLLNMAANPFY